MSRHRYFGTALIILANAIAILSQPITRQPNLIVIFTDEHNLRTLGCYREHMKNAEGNVWGKKVNVETPHIDSLARDGAIYLNYNAVAPLCTPSRASFMTGKYPYGTGAWMNHQSMNSDAVTWARILQLEDYKTGYIGKWHLNGDAKPDFANKARSFGFENTKYMFNRGHWKLFDEKRGVVTGYDWEDRENFRDDMSKAYATDFIFDKGIKFIKPYIKHKMPFALMMSIPDPHGPNDVRPPYNKMFKDKTFKLPDTAVAAYNKQPALPRWSPLHTDLKSADQIIEDIENSEDWQDRNRNYLGMVKLIDDNVGKLLTFLKSTDQDDNTVIVFTSDHGDMMGEHGKYNKGKPYKTSSGIPMIVRYGNAIKPGKIIKSAHTSPDFAPTLLSLMGIKHSKYAVQGIDGSEDLFNDKLTIKNQQVRFMTDSKQAKWAAAFDRHHKLVLSNGDVPWLFDTVHDPDEMINENGSTNPRLIDAYRELKIELFHAMKNHSFPLATTETIFFDQPFCKDPPDQIPSLPLHICSDLRKKEYKENCKRKKVQNFCPDACGKCCEDSSGEIWHNGDLITCPVVKVDKRWARCQLSQIKEFCPVTCKTCIPEPSSKPSQQPSASFEPTYSPSDKPSTSPTDIPSGDPSASPTQHPSLLPSNSPSDKPTSSPSDAPTRTPSDKPSSQPTSSPSDAPTRTPSDKPSSQPTSSPSDAPSRTPTDKPSAAPSSSPSARPSDQPTSSPSDAPSQTPTDKPSAAPSSSPSARPSDQPTSSPSDAPSRTPSTGPSAVPSSSPSARPSDQPTSSPSETPSQIPTDLPSRTPSSSPSDGPSSSPSEIPAANPSSVPSNHPSSSPSHLPTSSPSNIPSTKPSTSPSTIPTQTPSGGPSLHPSDNPSNRPTSAPSSIPSKQPSVHPSNHPSNMPTSKPSLTPTTVPSSTHSDEPSTSPSSSPSNIPTSTPTDKPSTYPSISPSATPTLTASDEPSNIPTWTPSNEPSAHPSENPSNPPSTVPSISAEPSISTIPTSSPSDEPSAHPSTSHGPTDNPSATPSTTPSIHPSVSPSTLPTTFSSTNPTQNPSRTPTSDWMDNFQRSLSQNKKSDSSVQEG